MAGVNARTHKWPWVGECWWKDRESIACGGERRTRVQLNATDVRAKSLANEGVGGEGANDQGLHARRDCWAIHTRLY